MILKILKDFRKDLEGLKRPLKGQDHVKCVGFLQGYGLVPSMIFLNEGYDRCVMIKKSEEIVLLS